MFIFKYVIGVGLLVKIRISLNLIDMFIINSLQIRGFNNFLKWSYSTNYENLLSISHLPKPPDRQIPVKEWRMSSVTVDNLYLNVSLTVVADIVGEYAHPLQSTNTRIREDARGWDMLTFLF